MERPLPTADSTDRTTGAPAIAGTPDAATGPLPRPGGNPLAERNTRWAMWLTAAMMVVEIAGGWWFNSMAVLADGWHMSSHAIALGLSVLVYSMARRYAHGERFAFGTWKIDGPGGYTNAMLLLGLAAVMASQAPAGARPDKPVVCLVVA